MICTRVQILGFPLGCRPVSTDWDAVLGWAQGVGHKRGTFGVNLPWTEPNSLRDTNRVTGIAFYFSNFCPPLLQPWSVHTTFVFNSCTGSPIGGRQPQNKLMSEASGKKVEGLMPPPTIFL